MLGHPKMEVRPHCARKDQSLQRFAETSLESPCHVQRPLRAGAFPSIPTPYSMRYAESMNSSKGWEAAADEHLSRLREALRRVLAETRSERPELSAGNLSRQLGRHAKYVSKMVTGEGLLRVEEVCELLERAGFPSGEVLQAVFPVGGAAEMRLRAGAGRGRKRDALPLEGLRESLRRVSAQRSPGRVVERCRTALRQRIEVSPSSQRELSRTLGMRSPRALGHALWGDTALTFEHVFRLLAVLDMQPATLFFEIFDPQEGDVAEAMTLPELLDRAHRVQRAAVATLDAKAVSESQPRGLATKGSGVAHRDAGGGGSPR